jgi:hypothetical protein
MRESSPPDATLSIGFGSFPAFGETRNCTRSAPVSDQFAAAICIWKNGSLHRQRLQFFLYTF